jgi:hypothetical protein
MANVHVVANNTQREDSHSKRIAPELGIAAEELRDDFIVVFCAKTYQYPC